MKRGKGQSAMTDNKSRLELIKQAESEPQSEPPGEDEASLRNELSILREILTRTANEVRHSSDAEFSRLGTLAVRLSDSIARNLLAQHKIELNLDRVAALQAEVDSLLKSMGLGPEVSDKLERRRER